MCLFWKYWSNYKSFPALGTSTLLWGNAYSMLASLWPLLTTIHISQRWRTSYSLGRMPARTFSKRFNKKPDHWAWMGINRVNSNALPQFTPRLSWRTLMILSSDNIVFRSCISIVKCIVISTRSINTIGSPRKSYLSFLFDHASTRLKPGRQEEYLTE